MCVWHYGRQGTRSRSRPIGESKMVFVIQACTRERHKRKQILGKQSSDGQAAVEVSDGQAAVEVQDGAKDILGV